jgi:hypothetical protein
MNKKTCDYKVNLNFQFSSHGLKIKPTDSEIKKTALDLLSEYLKETKKSKMFRITRNYSNEKYLQERKQERQYKKEGTAHGHH